MLEVLVVGSANADLTVRVDRRPGAGETVLGSDLSETAGGKGANQSAAAARLGGRVGLLARVGADALGRMLLDAQREAGADTSPVIVDESARTGTALIVVGPDGDNSIVVSPGANARLAPEDVASAGPSFTDARVVSLQLEIPYDTVAAAARTATAAGARVVLNPSPVPPDLDGLPEGVLGACDPLVVNEHEARQLAGSGDSPESWAQALRAAGARSVVVTLGAEGALVLAADGSSTTFPGERVQAVDTTGAGDAFTGALCVALARGRSLAEAARFAVRVGAAAVTREGAQASYPALEGLRGEV